jgi:hypothetical protein
MVPGDVFRNLTFYRHKGGVITDTYIYEQEILKFNCNSYRDSVKPFFTGSFYHESFLPRPQVVGFAHFEFFQNFAELCSRIAVLYWWQ